MTEYEQPLLRYAYGIVRDAALAQDVVQEAFIRLVKQLRDRGVELDNVKAWLYRVTHNLALDHQRGHARRQRLQSEFSDVAEQANLRTPHQTVAGRDAEAAAWQLMDELPEREQQIIRLKVVEHKSYKEIAEIMGLTTSNVGFILHTALKKLSTRLRERLS